MQRAIDLALLGAGYTASNPMVGCVIVHRGRIIGEGYHQAFGKAHAEVNAINSLLPEDKKLLSESTLYVNLEPCSYYGKTPPCSDLIVSHKIPRVVIGSRDPNPKVSGSGIRHLREAGIEVVEGVCAEAADFLNRRFFAFHRKQRPWIILKWAESANGIIGKSGSRIRVSGPLSQRVSHRWRAEEQCILVGTNTAMTDNPRLTTRYYPGPDPCRAVIDRHLKLPGSLDLLDGSVQTIVFNESKNETTGNILYRKIPFGQELPHAVAGELYQLDIISLLVEGGRALLQSFIDAGLWDEARVFISGKVIEGDVASPVLSHAGLMSEKHIGSDLLKIYLHE